MTRSSPSRGPFSRESSSDGLPSDVNLSARRDQTTTSIRLRWLHRRGPTRARSGRREAGAWHIARNAHPLSSSQYGGLYRCGNWPRRRHGIDEGVIHRAHPAAGAAGAGATGRKGPEGGATAPDHRRGQAVRRAPRSRRPHRAGHASIRWPSWGSPGWSSPSPSSRPTSTARLPSRWSEPFSRSGRSCSWSMLVRLVVTPDRRGYLKTALGGAGDRGGAAPSGLAPRRDREDEPPGTRRRSCGWRSILRHHSLFRVLIAAAATLFLGAWLVLLFEENAKGSNIHTIPTPCGGPSSR